MSRENIFNRLVDFRSGTQQEYDSMLGQVPGISDEDFYYVTRDVYCEDGQQSRTVTMPNLYIGQDLIGDAYNSQYIDNPAKRVTNPIGLIPYGMTLGKLINACDGRISKVIDMMLFTNKAPEIDECGIIAGFIPKIDVGDNWSDKTLIENWISNYVKLVFDPNRYEMFFDLEGDTISTLFTVDLDPDQSQAEYSGQDTGIYTGRMFVAVPQRTGVQSKDITTIVDKVFSRVYTGDGLRRNFIQIDNALLNIDEETYQYKVYLFGVNQSVIARIDMEYSVTLE